MAESCDFFFVGILSANKEIQKNRQSTKLCLRMKYEFKINLEPMNEVN